MHARASTSLFSAVLAAAIFAGCTASDPSAEAAPAGAEPDVVVGMIEHAFEPSTATLHVGGILRFENRGDLPHNAVARDESFRTPLLQAGESFDLVFTKSGEFDYLCTLHPKMTGTLIVTEAPVLSNSSK